MLRSDVKARARDSAGLASTELDDELNRMVDDTLLEMHRHSNWPWNDADTNVTIRGDAVMTCTWALAATVVTTVSGEPAAGLLPEYVGGMIQLNGANTYKITSWAAGTIGISAEIIDATQAAATAAIAIQDVITMPSSVESVEEVIDQLTPRKLRDTSEKRRNRLYPNPFNHIGVDPAEWWTYGSDAAGNVELVIFPPATSDRNLRITYRQTPTLPTADNDDLLVVTGIPVKFHPVITAGLKYRMYQFEFENQATMGAALLEYREGLADMKKWAKTDAGKVHALKTRHSRPLTRGRGPVMGFQTGKIDT